MEEICCCLCLAQGRCAAFKCDDKRLGLGLGSIDNAADCVRCASARVYCRIVIVVFGFTHIQLKLSASIVPYLYIWFEYKIHMYKHVWW